MKVQGEQARRYQAVRLDSFATVNRGPLVSADEDDGSVSWNTVDGLTTTVRLGPHAIRVIPCWPR